MIDKKDCFIGYEYQVIIPLMYMREHSNCEVVEITQFQMLDFRIKCAQEFAYQSMKVQFETGNDGLSKFINDYGNYVEIIQTGNDLSYRLKDSFTFDDYVSLIAKLDDDVRKVVTDRNIIKSCFEEISLS